MSDIFVICGKSGAGKDAVVKELERQYGLKQLRSYTTRPPRFEGESTHVFVDSFEEWEKNKGIDYLVGYTKFAGHEYWGTAKQVEESDLYIMDKDGIDYMRAHYVGAKKVHTIFIKVSAIERYRRMRHRGDSKKATIKRIVYDFFAFWGLARQADLVTRNDSLLTCVSVIGTYIRNPSSSRWVSA